MNDSSKPERPLPATTTPADRASKQGAESRSKNETLLLELGVIVAGRLDSADVRAVRQSTRRCESELASWFPGFRWKVQLIHCPEWGWGGSTEPIQWLMQAAEERETNRWDLVIVLTNLDLRGHYRRFAIAAVSRSLDAAVISTLRIDPDQAGMEQAIDERADTIANRLVRLMLHTTCHLCGLGGSYAADNLMYRVSNAGELDEPYRLDAEQVETMDENLQAMADLRLEEHGGALNYGRTKFMLKTLWINHRDIVTSVLAAKPWELPRQLSRLTTAAVSTVAIFLMTAEAWDLALSQSPTMVTVLAIASLLGTSCYVALRQQLIIRGSRLLTEQAASTQISSLLTVAIGMTSLWLLLVGLAVAAGALLYDDSLVAQWSGEPSIREILGSGGAMAEWGMRLKMASFTASIGVSIGALGTSFEDQDHLRHIIYVDEEI